MFWILLFLDMNNILTFHVSTWWYLIAALFCDGPIAVVVLKD